MQDKKTTKNKGGRPKKETPRVRLVGVRCSTQEKQQIIINAKKVQLSASEYLRILGLHQKVENKMSILPKEVLIFCADLNHIGSNLNQIAKKRNGFDPLTFEDRTELLNLKQQLTELVARVKSLFR